jgi:hypothetical protein
MLPRRLLRRWGCETRLCGGLFGATQCAKQENDGGQHGKAGRNVQ